MAPAIASAIDQLRLVFEERPNFDPAKAKRRFRIAASAYFECVVIPTLMARVAFSAPNVSLAVDPLGADIDTKGLATGELDLALGRFQDPDENLVVSPVMEDGFVCLVQSADFPDQMSISKEQYETLPHIIVSPPGRWRTGLFQVLDGIGLKRNIALTVSHFLAAPLAVSEIGGLVTLPVRIAKLYDSDSRYQLLPPPFDLGRFPMQLAWHPRHRNDPGHVWLRELVKDVCGSL